MFVRIFVSENVIVIIICRCQIVNRLVSRVHIIIIIIIICPPERYSTKIYVENVDFPQNPPIGIFIYTRI